MCVSCGEVRGVMQLREWNPAQSDVHVWAMPKRQKGLTASSRHPSHNFKQPHQGTADLPYKVTLYII
jgi:hypothetical protein